MQEQMLDMTLGDFYRVYIYLPYMPLANISKTQF